MASAAQRASLGRARSKDGSPKQRAGGGSSAAVKHSLEHRILITATLCLLAFGAVMVYSASSATTLLQGQGNGSGDLIKYVLYGTLGLVLMRVLARDGVEKVQSITAPLLVTSFVLVLAVHIPHVGVSVNGARRWIGPGSFQFEPSELLKLALVLYAATLLAKRPQRVHDLRELANPLLLVVGGVFVAETLSVMLQVAYFKLSGGRRIFLMSPLHHHFELKGWPESVVTLRFWLASTLCSVVGWVIGHAR